MRMISNNFYEGLGTTKKRTPRDSLREAVYNREKKGNL